MSLNWRYLRVIDNSQNASFERLCNFLAYSEDVPVDSKFTPIGAPDGGVECYWTLPNGNEWAWQAKYFLSPPQATQWNQMDDSVETALNKHPRLKKYIICCPLDRPDPRIEDQKSFMDRWNEHVQKWKHWAKDRGMEVEFDYWGAQEIWVRLSHEKNLPYLNFWFPPTDQDGRPTIPFLAPPRSANNLIGRNDLLDNLKQRILPPNNSNLLALYGIPGVGKSSLAIELAYDVAILSHFTDGVLWTGLGKTPDISALLGEWGRALGISELELSQAVTVQQRARALNNAIGLKKILLIIDDAWDLEVSLGLKVGGPNSVTIVTTRFPNIAQEFANENIVAVEELNEEDSLQVLQQFLQGSAQIEQTELLELVRVVGGLPLALNLMGRNLRKHGNQPRRIRNALTQLRDVEKRLQLSLPQSPLETPVTLPEGVPLSLLAVIQLSDDALDEKARQSFYALSVFPPKPNTFSEKAAVFITQNSAESLDTLYDYGLLEMGENNRYTLHQVINDYAQIKFTDITAFDRMTEFFIGLGEGHESDYNILDQELTNVFAALQSTVYRNLPQIFAHLANLYYKFLEARGYYDLAEATAPQALAAAQVVNDLREQQFAFLHLGRLSYRRGEYKQAANHFYAGLLIAYDRKDASCALDLLANFGGAVANVGDVDIARRQILDGLAMARSYGEPGSLMKLLGVIGSIEANDGNYDLAEDYLREALNLARQQGDGYEVTQYLTNLGALLAKRGAYSEAKPYFLEALELAKFKGEYENEFIAYSHWLSSAFAAQDYSFIEQTLPEAIKSAYRASMHQSLASLLVTILKITSVWTLEDPKSEKYLQDALPMARYFGDSSILLSILIRLGNISKNRGGFEEARDFFKESLSIAEELQEIDQIAELEKILGLMEANLNNYETAKSYWERALAQALEKAKSELVFDLLNSLATLAYHNEVYIDADNCFKQGLDIAYEKEDKETAIKFLMNLASVSFFTKGHTTAEEYFNQAIDLAKNIQNTEFLGFVYFNSGILYAKHDQLDKAILMHEAALSLARAEARYDHIANNLFSLAQFAAELNDISKARQLAQEAMDTLQTNNYDPQQVKQWLDSLSQN